MYQEHKDTIIKHFFDSKNRLSSPKLKKVFLIRNFPELIELADKHNMTYSQLIYHIMNNLEEKDKGKCIVCGLDTLYKGYFQGYLQTCKSDSCLRKLYGKNPPIFSKEICEKFSERMKKHNPMFNSETLKKAQNTIKEKYGMLPMHYEDNKIKSLHSRYDLYHTFSPKSLLYKTEEFTMPSGIVVKLQGYEPYALNELLQILSEKDIIICGKTYMFYYMFNNKKRRYYPDFYIPSQNLFIEVKSIYTYNIVLDQNIAKKEAVINKGFNHHTYIVENEKTISIIK